MPRCGGQEGHRSTWIPHAGSKALHKTREVPESVGFGRILLCVCGLLSTIVGDLRAYTRRTIGGQPGVDRILSVKKP